MKLRRLIAAVALCVMLCGMLPVQAAGTQRYLLKNGDFETGSPQEWQTAHGVTVSAEAAYTGAYGCMLTGDGGWDDLLWQTFTVVPGRTYTLTFWYKAQPMGVSWYLFDGGIDGVRLCRGWAGEERWTKVTKDFTPSSDTVCLLYRSSGSNLAELVYLDCVQVTTALCAIHDYDSACDILCNQCGFEREPMSGHTYSYPCSAQCSDCGEPREAPSDHVYDDVYDAHCNVCGHGRIPTPQPAERLSPGGASISFDVSGICFRFHAEAKRAKTNPDHSYIAGSADIYPFTNMGGYSLIRVGAVMSNEKDPVLDLDHLTARTINVLGKYLCKTTSDSLSFAVRIIHIPQQGMDTTIFARPYYVYSNGDEEIVVYGETVSRTFNELAESL